MDIEPDLTVCVVPGRNPAAVRNFLVSLYSHAAPVAIEVIVVDNHVMEKSGVLLDQEFPELIVLENSSPEDGCLSKTRAMQLAKGRYVSVWDEDLLVRPGCLKRLLDVLDETPEVGIAGPKIWSAAGTVLPSARTFAILFPMLLTSTALGKLFPHSSAIDNHLMRKWDHNDTRDVDWVFGTCQVVRRDVLEEIGFPDARLEGHYGALEFCRRARRTGWHVYYVHAAEVEVQGLGNEGGLDHKVLPWHGPSLMHYWRTCLQGRM